MLRLGTIEHRRFTQANNFEVSFGGGEANVAVSLANYGIESEFVSRLPENDIARNCLRTLHGYGVNTCHCITGGDRMGIYFLETGAVARPSKVIYDRTGSSFSQIETGMIDWRSIFNGADWFHWSGITPSLSQGAAEACLEAAKTAKEMGLTVSCDINYRKNLWKYGKKASEIMPELTECCDIIFGNEEDAEKVFGIKPDRSNLLGPDENIDESSFESVCRQLKERFPRAKKIIISIRGSINASHNTWGGVLFDGEKFYKSRRYDITHIVDRVGGGDSFMGGLIYGMLTYRDDRKALEFAAAASCLKHTVYGDFNDVTTDEVEALMYGNGSGRVIR